MKIKLTTTLLNSLFGLLLLAIGTVPGLTSCSGTVTETPDPANAVYYWRQELRLSDEERSWMERHEVKKMYLHLFDVERGNDGQLMPRTTLTVTDLPAADVEVIPVVFLTPSLMRDTTGLSALPELLVRRAEAIMQQNELGQMRELQIDFDWTRSNQMRYFVMLSDIRSQLDGMGDVEGKPRRLSATIRLHQLQMQAPPVDYGALMVYNVGHIQQYDEPNSILTQELVEPYLKHLRNYDLPLCTALPTYSWDLLFHDNEFRCILHGVNVKDTADYAPAALLPEDLRKNLPETGEWMVARHYMPIPPNGVTMRGDGRIFPGDEIRHEWVSPDVLMAVRQALTKRRPTVCDQIILYHLDEKQLKQYTDEDIKTIYSGR